MRIKVDYRMASKENYRRWKIEFPDSKLSYLQWSGIIYNFNYSVRDYILETGGVFKLLWGFGELSILKKKRKKFVTLPNGQEKVNLAIDWAKTRKAGKKIYHFNFHTDGYSFKWVWFSKTARLKYSRIWVFKPSRITSRMLKHYLSQEGYQHKYREWDIIK